MVGKGGRPIPLEIAIGIEIPSNSAANQPEGRRDRACSIRPSNHGPALANQPEGRRDRAGSIRGFNTVELGCTDGRSKLRPYGIRENSLGIRQDAGIELARSVGETEARPALPSTPRPGVEHPPCG